MASKTVKAATFKLITDTDALAKESLAIVKAVGNMDKRIQAYLLSEIKHISQHNNTTRLADFITSLKGKGVRMQAVVAWLVKFGPLDFDEEKQNIKLNKAKVEKMDMQAATDRMWTEEKPEGKLTPFSLNVELGKLVNKAINLQTNKRENVSDDIPDTTVAKLLELAAQLGLKIEEPKAKEAANDVANINDGRQAA